MRRNSSLAYVLILTALNLPGRSQPFPGDLSFPEPRIRMIARAEEMLASGEYARAREVLDSVLLHDDGVAPRVRALVMRANASRMMNDRVAADQDYGVITNLVADGIAGAEASRDRGTLLFEQRAFQQARDQLNDAVRRGRNLYDSPDSTRAHAVVAESWYYIGKCFSQYDQREEARWAYDSADAAFPRNPRGDAALFERASLAARDGDNTVAATLFQKLLDNYPRSSYALDARLRQAQCFVDLGNLVAATEATDQARELRQSGERLLHVPGDADAQLALLDGEIASGRGAYVNAGVHFARALGLPHAVVLHRSILFMLGWSAFQSGNNADAVAWFDSAGTQDVPRDGLNDRAEFLAALSSLRSGNETAGIKRLLDIAGNADHSKSADAALILALRYSADSSNNEAQKFCDRAIKRGRGTTTEARAEILKGEILLARQSWADAASAFRAAGQTLVRVDTAVDSVVALRALATVRLGYALARGGQYRDAVPVFVEYLGRYPNHRNAREAMFWLAESYYHSEALQSARDMYARYCKTPGGDHREEALYGGGWCEFRMRRFAESQKLFSRLVSEYPHSQYAVDAMLREADGRYLSRDWTGAAHAYEAAAARAGSGEREEHALYTAAQCYMRMGDHAKAISTLRTFASSHANSRLRNEALYLVGWNLFEQKQYAAAITELRALIASSPDSGVTAKALYTIGDAQYNSGEYEGALATYDKLVNTYPESPYVPAALASEQYCLNLLGRDSLAATLVPQFVERHADVPAARELTFKQGDVFFNAQKYGDAVKEFAEVAKRHGTTQEGATATYWMGKSYLNMGDTAHAIEAMELVLSKFPNGPISSTASLERARIRAAQGAEAPTRTAFESLLKQFAGTQDAANGAIDYAEFLLAPPQHDTVKALDVLTSASQGSSTLEATSRAQIQLGMIESARMHTDEAARWFSGVAQRPDGLGAEAQYRLGDAYRASGDFNDAITALLRVKAVYGAYDEWLTRSMLALGECYEATNQIDLARESYQTVMAFHHDDDFAKEAQTRMKKLKKP